MLTLKQAIQQAEEKHIAIGHFNISTVDALWAIGRAAKELNVPVVIGVSEGERDFLGVAQTRALVTTVAQTLSHPIFLNADHTYSLERVREVIDAGYDSVIFDGAKLSLEENIHTTAQCVDYARRSGKPVLVEAELGYIGSSSKLLDELPEGATVGNDAMPTPEDAAKFVQQTGVDLLSPAVGNIHGMLKGASNPNLNIELISQIRTSAGVPLVLHGGSGISDSDFTAAIKAGISMVHINTEIRLAWRDALKTQLSQTPDEIAPYKLLKPSLESVKETVTRRLQLFSQN